MRRFQDLAAIRITLAAGLAMLLISSIGCGPYVPDTIAAGGIVTINGEPLNNVEVRFVPLQDKLDGNYIARGVSDEQGKFELRFPGKDESGVVVGEHKVLVMEGPAPEDARGQSEDSQKLALKFGKTLKNRPIPRMYASMSESPLVIEVTADKTEYSVELERGKSIKK